jgi:flagellar hook-length control protein FliK
MSEVSRSASAAPKPAAAPASRGSAGKATEERGDAFSALLSLVAETRAAPAGEATAGESGGSSNETENDAQDPAKDGNDNPVAQLLGWADPRSSAGGVTPTGTADRAQATSQAAAVAADVVKAGGAGANITGMQPLATPEAVNPAGSASSATGTSITGLQPLATREATNPAAVPPGASPAAGRAVGSATPALGDARDARTSSTRRDAKTNTATDTTVALRAPAPTWQPLTNASARGTAAAGGSETLRGRSATWANSTVSMDLSAAREVDSVAGNAVSLTARLSAMLAGQAQADVAAPTPLLGATQDAGTHPAEAPSPADLLTSREAAPEPEPAQLSHWSTQHLRHAHLRLGEGALDSVDIRLSMQGQDLSVDFRTDNADIRQSLAQQANQSLATMLERSGIALADVSVGAQQQQRQPQGQGSEPQRGGGLAQVGRGPAGRAEAESVAIRAPAAQPLRADGSRPLDLFV